MNRRTRSEKLALLIQYGIDNPETVERAMRLLTRIAPETMTQVDVARRWPRILARLIVHSEGYFTPESAANALLAFRLGRAFSCEYYCFLAGFERNGFPRDQAEWDAKVRQAGAANLYEAIKCRTVKDDYDACADEMCRHWRRQHESDSAGRGTCSGCFHAGLKDDHAFQERLNRHQLCRHAGGRKAAYTYALSLVQRLAGRGASGSTFMSW